MTGEPATTRALHRGSLVALARLGADPRATPSGAPAAELTELGAVTIGLLDVAWVPLATALAHPLGVLRLDHRTPAGQRRIEGWVGSGLAVLTVPIADGRERLVVVQPGDVAWALAELVALGSGGGAHPDAEATPATRTVAVDALRPVPEGSQWRVRVALRTEADALEGVDDDHARPDAEVVRGEVGAIDDGRALWLVEPQEAPTGEVRLEPVGATQALARLAALQPVTLPPAEQWRPVVRQDLGVRFEVPADWPSTGHGTTHLGFTAPARRDDSAQTPRTRVSLAAVDEPSGRALARWRAALPVPRSLESRQVELPLGRATHEVVRHLDPSTGTGFVALAWAVERDPGHSWLLTARVATGLLPRDLDTVTEVAGRLRAWDAALGRA